jgi:hypothetical protein
VRAIGIDIGSTPAPSVALSPVNATARAITGRAALIGTSPAPCG